MLPGFLHNSSINTEYTLQKAVPAQTWRPMVHSEVSGIQSLDHCAALCHTSATNCDVFRFAVTRNICYLGDSTFTNGTSTITTGSDDIRMMISEFLLRDHC